MKNFILIVALLMFVASGVQARGQSSKKTVTIAGSSSKGKSGWLGVSIQDVTGRMAEKKNLKTTDGAYVTDVSEDSPAEQAGFQKGDVIVKFDDKKIDDSEDLTRAVQKASPGKEVKVDIFRDGQLKTLTAKIDKAPRSYSYSYSNATPLPPTLPRMPRMPRLAYSMPRLVQHYETYGLVVENITKQLAEYFEAPNKRGALVMEVKKGTESEKSGFKAGDVIIKVDGITIFDAEDFSEQLNGYDKVEDLKIEIIRKGKAQTLTIKVDIEDKDGDESEGALMPNGLYDDLSTVFSSQDQDELRALKEHMKNFRYDLKNEMYDLREKLKHELKRM